VIHAHLSYPLAGILALAASLPILAPSLFVDGARPAAAVGRTGGLVVVSSLDGASPGAPFSPSDQRRPTPGDERWWRGSAARAMTTTSYLSAPNPAPVPAATPPPTGARSAQPPPPSAIGSIELARSAPPELRLTARVPPQIRRWEPLILKAARKHDLDPTLIAAVMMTESSGNPGAVSPMGAIGLMQVLDGPVDPEANIDLGASMLSSHLHRFGSVDLALAAYNAGVGNVIEHGGVPPFQETHEHIARTLASYTAWRPA
jgi:soluble lytic murein transglycosylase-like protein